MSYLKPPVKDQKIDYSQNSGNNIDMSAPDYPSIPPSVSSNRPATPPKYPADIPLQYTNNPTVPDVRYNAPQNFAQPRRSPRNNAGVKTCPQCHAQNRFVVFGSYSSEQRCIMMWLFVGGLVFFPLWIYLSVYLSLLEDEDFDYFYHCLNCECVWRKVV